MSELSEMIEVRFDLDEPATWIGCGLDEPSDVRGVAAPSEPTGDVMVDDNDDEEEPTRGAGACKRSAAEAPMSVPGLAASLPRASPFLFRFLPRRASKPPGELAPSVEPTTSMWWAAANNEICRIWTGGRCDQQHRLVWISLVRRLESLAGSCEGKKSRSREQSREPLSTAPRGY